MSWPVTLITADSDFLAVTITAAPFDTLGMTPDRDYAYCATEDSWIKLGDLVLDNSDDVVSPIASAGAGSTFVPAKVIVYLDGARGDALSVVRDSADGLSSLTPIARDKIG
jgi:hypothetical protein